jgi:succinoglycan biosynthesis protein ExoO
MSAARPCVSVVTANYNGSAHLAAAVRSVLSQTLADLELIIVDDCSTDDSLEVIGRAADGDARVRVLRQDRNGGPAAARNRALAVARGRWIAVFDGDDLMAPERLEQLVARGEIDGCDIVADNLMLFDDAGETGSRPFFPTGATAEVRWITVSDYIASGPIYARKPNLGYLKPLFRAAALGGMRYNETLRIGEDYEFVLRLLLKGARMRLTPRALYRYRKHASSISSTLRREHIEAMLAADLGLGPQIAAHGPGVDRTQRARIRSLERALDYDRLISRLKARKFAAACALAIARPGLWPLLAMPIEARAKRLGARLKAGRLKPGRPALA